MMLKMKCKQMIHSKFIGQVFGGLVLGSMDLSLLTLVFCCRDNHALEAAADIRAELSQLDQGQMCCHLRHVFIF